MLLEGHYAVIFKPENGCREGFETKAILSQEGWKSLQQMAQERHFVILECWDITKGVCVSN
jgi:hypothetical protein